MIGKKNNLNEKKLEWKITIFADNSLAFVKDTRKEDKENSVIASWEETEPGRAALASLSRKRYMLEKRIEKGYSPTNEEIAFLKQPREKKQENKEPVVDKKKKTVKKPDVKEELDLEPKYRIDANKNLSGAMEHTSKEIQQFIDYCTTDRLVLKNENNSCYLLIS